MARKRKSGGLNRQRRKAEALLPDGSYVRGIVRDERGRTDGVQNQSAVSGVKPELPGTRTPRIQRSDSLKRSDIESLPADAQVYVNGHGKAKLAIYTRPIDTGRPGKVEKPLWPDNPDWPPKGWKL